MGLRSAQGRCLAGLKMFKCCRLAMVVGIVSLVVGMNVSAEKCGDLAIASMNWASAELSAEVDKFILTAGYGCNAELVSGDMLSNFESMTETGTPDIIPELWVSTMTEQLQVAFTDGRLIMASQILADGGEEGWWIPRYLADSHPDIKSVVDALARPDLFPFPDNEALGAIHNCPVGWNCQIPNANLFRAFGAEDLGFSLVDTGSAAGLDASIAKAYEDGEGWLGYYWSPTSMLGRYEMVRLDMGEHDPSQWHGCTEVADCADPEINSWPAGEVYTVVTREFARDFTRPMSYINNRQWSNETVNQMLAWMADNQATGDDVAVHFLKNYEDIWSDWIPSDVKARVKSKL